jgi:hypothetical protein
MMNKNEMFEGVVKGAVAAMVHDLAKWAKIREVEPEDAIGAIVKVLEAQVEALKH